MLLCAPEGEQHVVGLMMAADLLDDAGYNVVLGGEDISGDAFGELLDRHRPDLVGLTATMPETGPSLRASIAVATNVRCAASCSAAPARARHSIRPPRSRRSTGWPTSSVPRTDCCGGRESARIARDVGPLEGRVAAVTGASSGIGEATALALADAGAAVALGARRGDRLEVIAQRIEAPTSCAMDVSDEGQARAFVHDAQDQLGRLDILVNNAGVMLLGPVAGADTEEWRRMISVNLLGLLYCTRRAAADRAGRGGDIVNVSSVAGRRADAGAAVYNMTKFGVHLLGGATPGGAARGHPRYHGGPGLRRHRAPGAQPGPVVQRAMRKSREQIGHVLEPGDVAAAIVNAVTRPRHVRERDRGEADAAGALGPVGPASCCCCRGSRPPSRR